jgi:hypothetical protein
MDSSFLILPPSHDLSLASIMRVHKIFFFLLMPHDDHVIFSSSSPSHPFSLTGYPQAESQRSDQK